MLLEATLRTAAAAARPSVAELLPLLYFAVEPLLDPVAV